jgi:hypothetical protein
MMPVSPAAMPPKQAGVRLRFQHKQDGKHGRHS